MNLDSAGLYVANQVPGDAGQKTEYLGAMLASLDAGSLSRMLVATERLAACILPGATAGRYSPGRLSLQAPALLAASGLHNFVKAVADSGETAVLLDGLDLFSDVQQSGLLRVLVKDVELGGRLMDLLSDRSDAAKDSTISYLGALAAADHDDWQTGTLMDMVERSIDLMASFDFSDEQICMMNNQLKSMAMSDQRAYLAITWTGLAHLAGTDADMQDNTEIMETIDLLRSDATVRNAVFMFRLGDELRRDGRSFYQISSGGSGECDQQALIKVLATDAWINRNNDEVDASARVMHLCENLQALDAHVRTLLMHDLNRLARQPVPLAELSDEYLQEDTRDFLSRTDALANTHDAVALMDAVQSFGPELGEAFWRAAGMAGEEVGQLVDRLQEAPVEMGEKMLDYLSARHDTQAYAEISAEEGREGVHALINFFERNLQEEDRRRFLEGL